MADDYGIIISQPGTAVTDKAAKISLNTSNPFIKIDTQNKVAFQSILLLITTDPPEPPVPTNDTYTIVYKFKHGYSYIPAIETLFHVTAKPAGSTGSQTQDYFLDSGLLYGPSAQNTATLYATADNTWVYYIIDKYNLGVSASNLILTGTNVQITTHVFVEDVGV